MKKKKIAKEFSLATYWNRRIALKIAYLGWDYSGNTLVSGRDEDNSVEAKLIEAMKKIRLIESFEQCGLSRCGRTDKGVSAWANVVSLTVRSDLYG